MKIKSFIVSIIIYLSFSNITFGKELIDKDAVELFKSSQVLGQSYIESEGMQFLLYTVMHENEIYTCNHILIPEDFDISWLCESAERF